MRAAHPPRLLLLTGAAGKTGLATIRKLLELEADDLCDLPNLRIRALARSPGQCPPLEEAGVHETIVGDLNDSAALEKALEGVDSVYHVCPNVHPDELTIGRRVISLAQEAGVQRFVFHSVLQPAIEAMPHHWAKMSVEAFLAESDLASTVLQPAPYMQYLQGQWTSIAERGVYSVPYDLATRVSMVDLEDVAEAAARVLTRDGHAGATYELCAPGLLDQTEIAAALSCALGRKVRALSIDRTEWTTQAKTTGMTNHQIETLLAMFRYYERFGMTGLAGPLEGLLGRQPATFEQFVERVLQSGV